MDPTRHVPVLLDECVGYLAPAPGRVIVDLTLGGAGHARAFLEAGATVIGFDRDVVALDRAKALRDQHGDRLILVRRGFGDFAAALDELGHAHVDGILMDLGLSSDQLDDPTRGFAFRLEGPLDLRFGPDAPQPAWELIESTDAGTLETWLREYGEIRGARRLARAMVERAALGELRTTTQLAALVRSFVPRDRRPEPELARVFQALRIVVNQEMEHLDRALAVVPARLTRGGRFVAISYHSLEDRRVKRMLRQESGRVPRGSRHVPETAAPEATMVELTRKPVMPTEAEIALNPRARSARLRAGERR